jgi:PadR family transcriptional regulator, regulatory protein PadR
VEPNETLAGHVQELRRGTVVLACLAVLEREHYGYALLTTLADAGLQVDANTLYPLLRRLEKQELLSSAWNTDEPRPRKYYVVTDTGRAVRAELEREWRDLTTNVTRALSGPSEEEE